MAYGLQVFNNGTEVLYSKPARYLLRTVQINPSQASHVTRYTLTLTTALPVGTSVYFSKALDSDLPTVDHVFINNNTTQELTTYITAVTVSTDRLQVHIDTEHSGAPPGYTSEECRFFLYTYRGTL